MSEYPLTSICIPAYNAQSTIRETLESVTRQTYPNLEILVADNASTDRTLEIVGSFDDPRIKIHRSDHTLSAEENFNRCARMAAGKYTAIYHADDIYKPDIVREQVLFLENTPDAGAVFTEADVIDDSGKIIASIVTPRTLSVSSGPPHTYDFPAVFKAVLRHYNFLVCPSAMIRSDFLKAQDKAWRGEMFGSGADLDIWFRILKNYRIGILPKKLIYNRLSLNHFSFILNRKRTERADFFRVIDHYLMQDEVKAILDSQDLINYARQERTDRLIRAMNHVLLDQIDAADGLSVGVFSYDICKDAFSGRRGLKTFILGAVIRSGIILGLSVPLKFCLKWFSRQHDKKHAW